ncbi:AAA family ATPase [Shewanella sp. 1CM18E]|uniref:AAA family ATPase n=1 Tax=Shewanella sp. 1CM18E TaxID=2929169 RepID=UPI0020BDE797|nr:AAA family ATPase [Shewanella sp. 1CM18E]MCK8045320.1 AAA family ATPase [Shewanella sp. 1CM18E]
MDYNNQFDLYKEYVKTTLSEFPVDQTKLNCIAVFKALAELTNELEAHKNGSVLELVSRDMLQGRVSELYAASGNIRRQEVNKYLSQRFRFQDDKEPDFIEFTLEDDAQIYSRTDEVDAGSKRVAYRICQFTQRSKLIEYLCHLDLTLYYLSPSEMTLNGIINAYLGTFVSNSANQKWYEKYQLFTYQLQRVDELTEEQLETHWLSQSDGVASIKNGITSNTDFQSAKPVLNQITKLMKSGSDLTHYNQAIGLMQEAKKEQKLSKIYNAVLNRIAIAYNSDELTFPVDKRVMTKLVAFFNQYFSLGIETKNKNWFELSSSLKAEIKLCLPTVDPLKLNIIIWRINENKNIISHVAKLLNRRNNDSDLENVNKETIMSHALNQILYGPPGTGKTYHTVEAAVKAAEPSFSWQNRDELKAEYDRLVDEKRIRFVTFHQSYGYEEFVEGLKAVTLDGQLNYKVEPGIFKKSVTGAKAKHVSKVEALSGYSLEKRKIWKMSLGNTLTDEGAMVFSDCIENNYVLLGYGGDIDFEGCKSSTRVKQKFIEAGYKLKPQDYNVTAVNTLVNKMSIGDLVIVSDGNHKFKAIAEITSDYAYLNDGRDWYYQKRDVKWLMVFEESRPVEELFATALSQMTLYNLKDSVVSREKLTALLNESKQKLEEVKNHVLIIDEINRGNISKIFGELITLIEPSKRLGHAESLEVILPYSGDRFSVPNNLHIIGTMNTADRSLALMDTALRRRFDFVEMMPNYDVLRAYGTLKHNSGEVDLAKLLEVMNQRIEVLYDREHMLGHAFFIPVAQLIKANKLEQALIELKNVFKNKVLPLLQEYFFEDWNRIRLVLGDNQKAEQNCLIEVTSNSFEDIFGNNHGLGNYEKASETYQLSSFDIEGSIWDKAESYRLIYQPKSLQSADDK